MNYTLVGAFVLLLVTALIAAALWLASGGGNLHSSYLMGRKIRDLRKPTRVPGPGMLHETLSNAPETPAVKSALDFLMTDGAECSSACGMLLVRRQWHQSAPRTTIRSTLRTWRRGDLSAAVAALETTPCPSPTSRRFRRPRLPS